MTKQNEKTVRNQKFMDFYHDIKDQEEYLGLKKHKRVKYLSEQFANRTQLNIPVGTIYKLLRSEHVEIPSSDTTVSTSTSSGESNEVDEAE